jgi:hypothetical protein
MILVEVILLILLNRKEKIVNVLFNKVIFFFNHFQKCFHNSNSQNALDLYLLGNNNNILLLLLLLFTTIFFLRKRYIAIQFQMIYIINSDIDILNNNNNNAFLLETLLAYTTRLILYLGSVAMKDYTTLLYTAKFPLLCSPMLTHIPTPSTKDDQVDMSGYYDIPSTYNEFKSSFSTLIRHDLGFLYFRFITRST